MNKHNKELTNIIKQGLDSTKGEEVNPPVDSEFAPLDVNTEALQQVKRIFNQVKEDYKKLLEIANETKDFGKYVGSVMEFLKFDEEDMGRIKIRDILDNKVKPFEIPVSELNELCHILEIDTEEMSRKIIDCVNKENPEEVEKAKKYVEALKLFETNF